MRSNVRCSVLGITAVLLVLFYTSVVSIRFAVCTPYHSMKYKKDAARCVLSCTYAVDTCGVVLCGGRPCLELYMCGKPCRYPDVRCISLPPFSAFRYKSVAVFKGESRCLSDE